MKNIILYSFPRSGSTVFLDFLNLYYQDIENYGGNLGEYLSIDYLNVRHVEAETEHTTVRNFLPGSYVYYPIELNKDIFRVKIYNMNFIDNEETKKHEFTRRIDILNRSNKFYIFKIFPHHINVDISELFSTYETIILERKNKLKQFLSLIWAEKIGQWVIYGDHKKKIIENNSIIIEKSEFDNWYNRYLEYIEKQNFLNQKSKIIYYEDWENNLTNILYILDLPIKKIEYSRLIKKIHSDENSYYWVKNMEEVNSWFLQKNI